MKNFKKFTPKKKRPRLCNKKIHLAVRRSYNLLLLRLDLLVLRFTVVFCCCRSKRTFQLFISPRSVFFFLLSMNSQKSKKKKFLCCCCLFTHLLRNYSFSLTEILTVLNKKKKQQQRFKCLEGEIASVCLRLLQGFCVEIQEIDFLKSKTSHLALSLRRPPS